MHSSADVGYHSRSGVDRGHFVKGTPRALSSGEPVLDDPVGLRRLPFEFGKNAAIEARRSSRHDDYIHGSTIDHFPFSPSKEL